MHADKNQWETWAEEMLRWSLWSRVSLDKSFLFFGLQFLISEMESRNISLMAFFVILCWILNRVESFSFQCRLQRHYALGWFSVYTSRYYKIWEKTCSCRLESLLEPRLFSYFYLGVYYKVSYHCIITSIS
jgi:hypothetical protein